jgi:E3 ubiquitin-protein ligase DOA10
VRPISLIGKPIYLLRSLVDPVIRFILNHIISPIYNNFETICEHILPTSILIAIKTIHGDVQSGLYYIVKSIHITLHDNGGGSLAQLLAETTSSILDHTNTIHNWDLIRSNMYSISAIIFKRWRQCATDQGSFDRAVCTAVGYIVLISIGSWYLSKNKSIRAGSTNEILRQQGVFLKVLVFIFLELVIFPTVCGVLLDISTLPLFTEVSIKSRFHFVLLNPYSGVFLHWFVGTGFIFHFSVFVALVREVVRPGVLFFIRDPNDPQFHPVQDMVDQPILVLLRNLVANAAAYFMLIMVGMGLVTLLVSKYGGIYPIIWKFE